MKGIWLVRHGQTTYTASRRVAGWSNPPLTELGRTEARAVAPVLDGSEFDSVWSSDLDRTVSTSRLAWGEPRADHRLREVNFGAIEGGSYDTLDVDWAVVFMEFRNFEIPDGESYRQFRDRIHGFVDDLPTGRHLLFVHGGVIRILTQDLGIDRFVGTGSVVALDWTGQRVLFVREPTPPPAIGES
jgi:probable phosphoglycerate mutase